MSGYYIVVNKDKSTTPVHNLATGLYYVGTGEAEKVIDRYTGRTYQK